MPGGRLDPPLLMALDEIVQTCPVPLPAWLADSGGKGIQLIPVAHGEAQLRTRWGKDGAQVVLDTCGVKVWLPGITDTATLKMASELCGQAAFTERDPRPRPRRGRDEHRRIWHDVMTPDMIRQLPAGHAPGHPRQPRPGHRPARRRLEGPRLQGRPPRRHRHRPARPAAGPAGQPPATCPARRARLRAVPDVDAEAAGGQDGDDVLRPTRGAEP